jgi:hypothetical protein
MRDWIMPFPLRAMMRCPVADCKREEVSTRGTALPAEPLSEKLLTDYVLKAVR